MDRYAVFGHPIAHSKSPKIHRLFAEQTGLALSYEAILAPVDGFADTWAKFAQSGGQGANVTVPFKEQAFLLASKVSERAKLAGAVNTLYLDDSGILCGDNTDGVGLVADLRRLGVDLQGIDSLVLGAGGAARGVIAPLLQAGVKSLHIANRTQSKAHQIAALFSGQVSASNYETIPQKPWTLVINATSSGLTQERPAVSALHLQKTLLAYDMLYGNTPTPFLAWCASHGVRCADGLGMLVEQAAESFFIWHKVKVETDAVLKVLRQELNA